MGKLLVLFGNLKKKKAKDNIVSKMSLFTCILTTVPMQAKHRVVCAKHAITENMVSENYGVVLQLVDMLASKNPAVAEEMAETVATCEAANGTNVSPWAQGLDLKTLKFCYKSLKILEDGPCLQCNFCDALYADTSLSVRDM